MPCTIDSSSTGVGMEESVAAVFPAFGMKFTGKEDFVLRSNGIDINQYRAYAIPVAGSAACDGGGNPDGISETEISLQYLSYQYCCAFSDLLKRRRMETHFAAGYSMGLYACLYHGGSIAFEQGLLIIKKAHDLLLTHCDGILFAMCAIIGLTSQEIQSLLSANRLDAEIINSNGDHSFVLCGEVAIMIEVCGKALREGALQIRQLPIRTCYHTKRTLGIRAEFRDYLESSRIEDAVLPIVSTTQLRVVRTAGQLIDALVENLTMPFDWANTMRFFNKNGVRSFIECGPGNGLSRIARSIPGDFNFRRIEDFDLSDDVEVKLG